MTQCNVSRFYNFNHYALVGINLLNTKETGIVLRQSWYAMKLKLVNSRIIREKVKYLSLAT